jgi:hypothetical protein
MVDVIDAKRIHKGKLEGCGSRILQAYAVVTEHRASMMAAMDQDVHCPLIVGYRRLHSVGKARTEWAS